MFQVQQRRIKNRSSNRHAPHHSVAVTRVQGAQGHG